MELLEICKEINNYFESNKVHGSFTIKNGNIEPNSFLKEEQYFRIVGSTFNDGIYKFPTSNLTDEEFVGAVWPMRVPPALLDLCTDISDYENKNEPSNITSESIGGYSYSRATDGNGNPTTWQTVFANRLNTWRKK